MTLVDWTEVGLPPLRLTLEREASGHWIAVDARDGDTVYFRSPNLGVVIRFMRAFSLRHNARLDEAAISWARAQQSSGEPTAGHSGLLARPPLAMADNDPRVSQAAGATAEPASPDPLTPDQLSALAINRLYDLLTDPHSRRVPDRLAPVIPIRKETA